MPIPLSVQDLVDGFPKNFEFNLSTNARLFHKITKNVTFRHVNQGEEITMRIIGMMYGLLSYLLGIFSLIILIFAANNHMGIFDVETLLPLNIDQFNGAPSRYPLLLNIGLLALFGLQHSIMARPGFKAKLVAVLPASLERSTYVLATAIVIIALVQYWQPMAGSLWHVENELGRQILNILFYTGWLITFLATYMLNHFHLFGLQQSFRSHDPDAGSKEFKTPLFYKLVRHPIQTGVAIAMLATPDMTTGRAVLAAGMLLYIAIGLYFEERDLITEFGDTYRDYKTRVPSLFPMPGRKAD